MKKIALIIGVIFAACAFSATAQEVSFESDNNTPYLGIRLGLDISCPTNMKISDPQLAPGLSMSVPFYDNGAGFDLGAIYNIPLWKNLYFEPGLSLYYNTMGIDFTTAYDETNGIPEDAKASIRRFGFRMPFQVGYRIDFSQFSLAAFTGPVLSVGVIGREHYSFKTQGVNESGSTGVYGHDGGLNRADIGWKIGAGVEFDRFVLQLSGTIGMCNMLNGVKGAKYRDNNVALTIGYNFRP